MTALIEPDVDAYGRATRYEALADLVEVWAIQGTSATQGELADYLKDRGWLNRRFDLYSGSSEEEGGDAAEEENPDLGTESDRSLVLSESIFDVLKTRQRDLGDLYPFELSRGRLKKKMMENEAHGRYLALLAVSFFHGHKLEFPDLSLTESIERIVEDSLSAQGLNTARMGSHGADQRSFKVSLEDLGDRLRLPIRPDSVVLSQNVKDAGVDVVARLDFQDNGPGRWVFIGQVTCGKSDTWEGKARQPSPSRWRRLLGLSSRPGRFFAVPHEIPESFRDFLCEGAGGDLFLLDRKRLTCPERPLLSTEQKLVGLFDQVSVEAPH